MAHDKHATSAPANRDADDAKSPMRSVERIITILSLFAEERNGLSTQDISLLTDIPKSTCSRLLRCLVEAGLLEKSGTLFGVGNTILRMAQGGQMYERLRRVALPYMRKLSRQTGKTVGLSIVNKDNFRICIEQVQNTSLELRNHTPLRTPLPLHIGATGKVLWAYLPDQRRLQVYRDNAMEMTTTWEQCAAEFATIRAASHLASANERILGACSIAAPILGEQNDCIGVLTVSAVQQQFTTEEIETYTGFILDAASSISQAY